MTATTTSRLGHLALVPGSGCDERLFAHQIRELSPDATIHLVDNVSYSRIEELAREELEKLPERFALAGLSMGGLVALEMIRQAPERISGLALLDTLPEPGLASDRTNHRLAIATISLRLYGPIEKMMWPRYVAPGRLEDGELRGLVKDMMIANGVRGLINQQRIFITRPDYRPILRTIGVPALVLVGEEDTLAPPRASVEAASEIPDAELVVVPGSGHLSTLEAPEAVTTALRSWLERVASNNTADGE